MSPTLTHARRGLAGIAGLALAGGALVAVAPHADAAPVPATSGSAQWGIKESWRTYIDNNAAGGATSAVADGATRNPDYTWSAATKAGTYDAATGAGSVPLRGKVTYTYAAHNINEITIANPTVVFDGQGNVELRADTKYALGEGGPGGAPANEDRKQVVFATSTSAPAATTAAGDKPGTTKVSVGETPLTITAEGSAVFGGGSYPAGTSIDPISVSFLLGDKVSTSTTLDVRKAQLKKLKAGKRGTVTVAVAVTGVTTDAAVTGKVVIKDRKKTLRSVTLVDGKAGVKLPKLKRGKKHVLRATYSGSDQITKSVSKAITVKVKKR